MPLPAVMASEGGRIPGTMARRQRHGRLPLLIPSIDLSLLQRIDRGFARPWLHGGFQAQYAFIERRHTPEHSYHIVGQGLVDCGYAGVCRRLYYPQGDLWGLKGGSFSGPAVALARLRSCSPFGFLYLRATWATLRCPLALLRSDRVLQEALRPYKLSGQFQAS